MAHPQNSPRGYFAKARIDFPAAETQLTYNTTGVIFSGGAYLNGQTASYLTANSTALIVTGPLKISNAAGGQLTANSTGVIAASAVYVSGKTQAKISANTTTTTVANALAVSGQATVGKLAANSTALLLPATGFQMAALSSLKVTSDSTGIKIGSLYVSCNSTGNTTT